MIKLLYTCVIRTRLRVRRKQEVKNTHTRTTNTQPLLPWEEAGLQSPRQTIGCWVGEGPNTSPPAKLQPTVARRNSVVKLCENSSRVVRRDTGAYFLVQLQPGKEKSVIVTPPWAPCDVTKGAGATQMWCHLVNMTRSWLSFSRKLSTVLCLTSGGGAGQGGCKQRAKYDVLLEQPRFVFI